MNASPSLNQVCPHCNTLQFLINNGKFRKHKNSGSNCIGSGLFPPLSSLSSVLLSVSSKRLTRRNSLLTRPLNQSSASNEINQPTRNNVRQNSSISNSNSNSNNNTSSNNDNDDNINNEANPVQVQVSQFKVRTKNRHRNHVLRQWSIEKIGPLFTTLENTINSSVNPTSDEEIQSLLRQILTCTPPFKKIENTCNSTTQSDSDTDSEFDSIIPIAEKPIINNEPSKNYEIKKALEFGNLKKCRQLLQSSGIKSLDIDTINEIISKFPNNSDIEEAPVDTTNLPNDLNFIDFSNVETQLLVIQYLNRLSRGAASSALGWSTDNIQDLLFYYPLAIKGFFQFLQLITNGQISEETKSLLYRGRGIPLDQKTKVRPIIIQCPFHKVASHILIKHIKDKIITICGDKQLGNAISGGVEILVHLIRILLDLNPDWVLIKIDTKNAFNELSRKAAINAVIKHVPEVFPYVNSILEKDSDVFFNENNKNICVHIKQSVGVPQGSPSSGPIYNITQSDQIKAIQLANPNVEILSFHDDHCFLGNFGEATNALLDFDREFALINLKRQPKKSKIYRPLNPLSDAEIEIAENDFNLEHIKSIDGIEVAGSPIGSKHYIQKFLDDRVENIKNQLDLYMNASNSQHSRVSHDAHTLYIILRKCISSQFTHLLRTCLPSDTYNAAEKLDDYVVQCFIKNIKATNEFQNFSREKVKLIKDELFLPIHLGGKGLISSRLIADAAFIGSISLCASWIGKIIPRIITTEENINQLNLPSTLNEFKNLLITQKQLMPQELQKISLISIWESSHQKIQSIITKKLYEQKSVNLDDTISNGISNLVITSNHNNEEVEDRARIITRMSNKNRYVSAWLNHNPADTEYHLNNCEFSNAMKSSLHFDLKQGKKYCSKCAVPLDMNMTHPYRCTHNSIKNKLRYTSHQSVASCFKRVLSELLQDADWRVNSNNEPLLKDFPCPLIEGFHPNTLDNNNSNHHSYASLDENNMPNTLTNHRADISLKNMNNGKFLLIDIQLTDPYSESHSFSNITQPANKLQSIKINKYRRNGYETIPKPDDLASFNFPTFTICGAPSKDAHKLLKIIFKDHPKAKMKTRLFWSKFSTIIQKVRSHNLLQIQQLDFFTSSTLPFIPNQINRRRNNLTSSNNVINSSSQVSQISNPVSCSTGVVSTRSRMALNRT